MLNQKIEELKCYPQVASVIGDALAKIELREVLRSGILFINEDSIDDCFLWSDSPQGNVFWRDIYSEWVNYND